MHSGVPQGFVIGPLMIRLFVNDLPDVLDAMTLFFADDVKMVARRVQSMGLVEEMGPTDQCDQTQLYFSTDGSGATILAFK